MTHEPSRTDSPVVAVDFDGVIVRGGVYPHIGSVDKFVVSCLNRLQQKGVWLVMNTCRHGDELAAAIMCCASERLVFDAINENLAHRVDVYGDCRKIGGDIMIDDRDICYSRLRLYVRLGLFALLYPHWIPCRRTA